MKVRISVKDKLTRKEKQVVVEYLNLVQKENARKFMKLACISLNRQFKFGSRRLSKFLESLIELSESVKSEKVSWEGIDYEVIDTLKVPFDRETSE